MASALILSIWPRPRRGRSALARQRLLRCHCDFYSYLTSVLALALNNWLRSLLRSHLSGIGLVLGSKVWYVTSHPGQLSLAIPPRVGAMSIPSKAAWDVNSCALDS